MKEIEDILAKINRMGKQELWRDSSPIWARPQADFYRMLHLITVNSSKFKSVFHTKPHMIPREQVADITGFQPGGVCPFAVPKDIPIWLDVSMKRFEYVHPAGGNEFTSVKITPDELERVTDTQGWCDVSRLRWRL